MGKHYIFETTTDLKNWHITHDFIATEPRYGASFDIRGKPRFFFRIEAVGADPNSVK